MAGVLLYVLAMPWIANVMVEFGGLGRPVAVPIMMLLHAYLALYVGAFAWGVSRLARRSASLAFGLAPLWWAGLEWTRGWMLSGFPWIPLSLSQWKIPALVQLSSWGAPTRSLPWCAWGAPGWPDSPPATPEGRAASCSPFWPPSSWLGPDCISGGAASWRRSLVPSPSASSRPASPLEVRWNPTSFAEIEGRHFELSTRLVERGADVILWSESSLPSRAATPAIPVTGSTLQAFVRDLATPLLFGGTTRDGEVIYNSAFAIDAQGHDAGRYDKHHLVPFGEYVPWQRFLFFAEKLVREVGEFGRGEGAVPISLGPTQAGVPICYEIVFPRSAEASPTPGPRS